jgi:hypothetical protein
MSRYPKECFSINETATRNAKAEYDKKKKLWYKEAERLFPNYWDIEIRERIELRDIVSESVGFYI